MSLVTVEREPLPRSAVPDSTSSGMALSAALHILLGGLFAFGLPNLFPPPAVQEMPIAVALVTVGPETRATHPNPYTPHRHAKPIPAKAEPTPLPEVKPEPPQPAPTPPASRAAAAPAPPKPPQARPRPKPKPTETAMALPKPEPKPAPAKAEPTPPLPREKPTPPPQLARNEPHPAAKKYDSSQFQSLLKNLATDDAATDPKAPPQRARAVAVAASSQPRAPLGSQLTTSEMDLVREQISRCWNVPAGARDAKDLVVEIQVAVDPDGKVREATIVDQARMDDPFYRAAAESARRAFFNPLCRPLRLPPDKYAVWKNLVVNFSPKDLL